MIFVGYRLFGRLRGGVLFAETVTNAYFVDLSTYPKWLVVLVGTLAAALIIWILIKLMKVALWLLFYGVLIGGLIWAVILLLQ